MKKSITLLAISAILAATAQMASAATNIVQNYNFSANAADFTVPDNYIGGGNPTTIPGWDVTYLNGGITGYNSGHDDGNFIPTGYSSANPLDANDGTFIFLQNTKGTTESQVTQTLTLAADTIYSLSFDYAPRNGEDATGLVAVTDNGTLLGGYSNTVTAAEGANFLSSSTTFTTGSDVSGALLTLSKVAEGGDHTIDFTNVNITAIGTVPEPSTYALAGLGLVLLVVALRARGSVRA